MITLAVYLFFGFIVAFTGPAFDKERAVVLGIFEGYLQRRQLRLGVPKARALYLPSGSCRPTPVDGRCQDPDCAICQARRQG